LRASADLICGNVANYEEYASCFLYMFGIEHTLRRLESILRSTARGGFNQAGSIAIQLLPVSGEFDEHLSC
jgi:hypothetical protein